MKDTRSLSIPVVGMSLGLFFVISYLLCIAYGLVVTDVGMHQMLDMMMPGFVWLTWSGFLAGLAWAFGFGWYAAFIFVPLYNFFAARQRNG